MSHTRRSRFDLRFTDEGGAELTHNGATVWASDADPDFVDEFGDDLLAYGTPPGREANHSDDDDDDDGAAAAGFDDMVLDVFDYLIEAGYLTEAEADRCEVYLPKEPIE